MYRRELRKRGDINSVDINRRITSLFSGTYPNRYTNNSLNYYENLKKVKSFHIKNSKLIA